MTTALIDDQLLGRVLRGQLPRYLGTKELCTTGCWYLRLCQAVVAADRRTGVLSQPFADLPPELRERAMAAVLVLPPDIGLVSLRELAPVVAQLRKRHQLNLLAAEALGAAVHLGADVFLSASSPRLEQALTAENLTVSTAMA